MTNVVLTIGGRDYSMACAAGEEAHLRNLARTIDEKLATLPESATQNDSRSLVFAALLLADELYELRKAAGEQPPPAPPAPVASPAPGEVSPERLDALAERLEALVHVLGIAA